MEREIMSHLLEREQAVLVIVDLQERLAQTMKHKDRVASNTAVLVKAAQRLEVPVLVTVQYRKGLGELVDKVAEVAGEVPTYEKLSFDACGQPEFLAGLESTGRRQVLLTGMECHVCVLQSAASLLEQGYAVHVVADAVCSRIKENWRNGLERMHGFGAQITNTESALFELLRTAENPAFRDLSRLIR
jgi:nicotinamidase-related amidase